jgi:hypothetical protein
VRVSPRPRPDGRGEPVVGRRLPQSPGARLATRRRSPPGWTGRGRGVRLPAVFSAPPPVHLGNRLLPLHSAHPHFKITTRRRWPGSSSRVRLTESPQPDKGTALRRGRLAIDNSSSLGYYTASALPNCPIPESFLIFG